MEQKPLEMAIAILQKKKKKVELGEKKLIILCLMILNGRYNLVSSDLYFVF